MLDIYWNGTTIVATADTCKASYTELRNMLDLAGVTYRVGGFVHNQRKHNKLWFFEGTDTAIHAQQEPDSVIRFLPSQNSNDLLQAAGCHNVAA